MTKNTNQKTLCPIPWMSQSLRSNGDIRVCCQAQHGPTGGVLKDKQGKSYNAKTANLKEARNSDLSKEIRRHMMEGKWHPECKRCQDETSAGMNSRITYENEIWIKYGGLTWEYLLEHTDKDGTINVDEINCSFYDVRFGNLCNLKCRMCGPTDSSKWYDDQVKMWGTKYRDSHGEVELVKNNKGKYKPKTDIYNWHESDVYWEQMDNNINEIKRLYIVGGEPLLIDKHYEFLKKCVDKNVSHKITLEYNTNITSIPEKALDIWKNFKQVRIGASIDGVGSINDYMRYPSKFNKIYDNLKKLSEAEGNYRIWIACTINVFNVLHFPEFMEWIIINKLPRVNDEDRKPIITPHPLHSPKFYNIKVLPHYAKKAVESKYEEYRIKLKELVKESNFTIERKKASIKQIDDLLTQYINYMYADDYSDHLPSFWEATRKLDKIRGHNIEDHIPELYELLKDTET